MVNLIVASIAEGKERECCHVQLLFTAHPQEYKYRKHWYPSNHMTLYTYPIVDISGPAGPSGPTGTTGPTGPNGISGYSGYSGISGYSGGAGPGGYSGYSGYSGTSGYSGAVGAPLVIKGSVLTSADLPSSYLGAIGDGYIASNNLHLWVWSGTEWIDVGNIQGTSGYSGISGYSGVGGPGTSGYSGISGYSGVGGSGYSGKSGFSGYSGAGGSG